MRGPAKLPLEKAAPGPELTDAPASGNALPQRLYRVLSSVLGEQPLEIEPFAVDDAEPGLLPTLGALQQRVPGLVPTQVEAWARHAHRHAAARNLDALETFLPVALGLENAGLPWAALKGLDLVGRLYPNVGWRAMSDFDILVYPRDLELIDALLAKHGFEQQSPRTTRIQPARTYRRDRLFVDVHVRLGPLGVAQPRAERLLACTQLVSIGGCPIRRLSDAESYLALAVLMAKDAFAACHLDALRLAELRLLGDRIDGLVRAELAREARRGHWRRCLERAQEIEAWVGGGAPPRWRDPRLGEPGSRNRAVLGRWRRIRHVAALRDGFLGSAFYLATELGTSALRLVSGRRLGTL